MIKNYSSRFADPDQVASYEMDEYAPNGYSAFIWKLQQPVLRKEFEIQRRKLGTLNALDFACGSGRIISFIEPLCEVSEGLDISEAMVARARARCHKSGFMVGDICSTDLLKDRRYNIITTFRFLLNTEPAVREQVLRALRSHSTEDGVLIANMHGSRHSVRHLFILLRHIRASFRPEKHRGIMAAEMSPAEVKLGLETAGFDIVRRVGFGVVPAFLYRTPLRGLCQRIDRFFSSQPWAVSFSIDILFVCRPKLFPND